MSNQDQHYTLKIVLQGNSKVSFVTALGWEEEASIIVDAVNVEGVNKAIEEFFKQRKVVPFENCTYNECHVEKAEKDIQGIKYMVADTCWSGHDGVLYSIINEEGIYIGIEITKSYVV